tara:strand:+ start:218 stop:472 length:255 start_codon:yes stop_codon:yes gene_type:complete
MAEEGRVSWATEAEAVLFLVVGATLLRAAVAEAQPAEVEAVAEAQPAVAEVEVEAQPAVAEVEVEVEVEAQPAVAVAAEDQALR